MKKRITSLMLILVVAVSMTMGASAASYIPDDVTYQNLNGQQLAIKTYTLLPDQDPSDLYEDDFEYDGFLYSMSDIVKEEQRYQEENAHTEVVTVTTASKNLEDILVELKPTIEYDDGVSSGTLSLDHSTLKTEAAGYKRSSYTVTATKNYTGLDRNDSSYIDKTVEKNGRTLSLSNVTWSVESTALVGDELVPATYSAVATYSGSASSTVATGYITTAEYKGTVVSSGISSSRDAIDEHCREVIRSCLNIVEQHGDTYVAIHKDDDIECIVLVSMIRSYPILSIIVADKLLLADINAEQMHSIANELNLVSVTGWHSVFLADDSMIYMYRQCLWLSMSLTYEDLLTMLKECISEYKRGKGRLTTGEYPTDPVA